MIMGKRLSAYSLLEIILVTTMLIIFIIVINPGTYIDHFSKILFKMNVLNESQLLIQKMNIYATDDCFLQSVSNSQVRFLNSGNDLSLNISDYFSVKNHQTNIDAFLFKNIDLNLSHGFSFYDIYLYQNQIPSDINHIEFSISSSLLDYSIQGTFICKDYSVILGEF